MVPPVVPVFGTSVPVSLVPSPQAIVRESCDSGAVLRYVPSGKASRLPSASRWSEPASSTSGGGSSSTLMSETSSGSRPEYSESPLTAGAVTMVYDTSPSSSSSSTPVTVTTWGMSQFDGVKTRLEVLRVPSVSSLEDSEIVTLAVGWRVRVTWNVPVLPSSLVFSSI